nr:hypothetical protein [Tanacetum cinerariifolium]
GAGRSTIESRQQSVNKSAYAEETMQSTCQMEETPLSVCETGADDQPIIQTSQHPEWFSQPWKPPSPDRAWNTALPAAQGDAQTWISDLAKQADARSSFNKLLDTPIEFSNFIMHRLNIDTLTPDLLASRCAEDQPIVQTSQHPEWFSQPRKPPTPDRDWNKTLPTVQGSAQTWISELANLTELEYHLEEVYKVTTDQLDWVNPEGQQYPHNMLQPLPLIPDN